MEQGYLTGHTAYWSQICLSLWGSGLCPDTQADIFFLVDSNLIDVKWRNIVILQRAAWSSGCGCITGKGQRCHLGWTQIHFCAESDLWFGCLGDSRSWTSLLSLHRTLPKALTVLKHAQSPWWKSIMLPLPLPWPLDSLASVECRNNRDNKLLLLGESFLLCVFDTHGKWHQLYAWEDGQGFPWR